MTDNEVKIIIDEVSKNICNYLENVIELYLETHLENRIAMQNDSPFVETITVDEFAKAFKLSKPIAYEVVNRKDFPSFKIGKSIRIDKHLLNDWLARQLAAKKGVN